MAEVAGRDKNTKLSFEEISKLNERKLALKENHQSVSNPLRKFDPLLSAFQYLKDHPEMKNILSDFM